MAQHDLHRFPRGETCADCPARRWYLESGRRYCQNGHQVEGYIQQEVDLDDNFGKMGKTTRMKKEKREKLRKHLVGNAAKELYLECFQVLLRKQVAWMVGRGAHPELEGVVKGLWELRTRGFKGLGVVGGKEKEGVKMYSSQAEGEDTEEEGVTGTGKKRWRGWEGEEWVVPGIMEGLGMVYLGCLLRQEPVKVGDIFRWARSGQMPFLGAINLIPDKWRDRLPGWAQKVLLTQYAKFGGGELHTAVTDLMLGYREHYELVFPKIPVAPLLLVWIRDLGLPAEVHHYAQELCSRLGLIFTFPTRERLNWGSVSRLKHSLIDNPDILLAASVVVATKYIYPLDGVERFPVDENDPLILRMNWSTWEAEFPKPETKVWTRVDYGTLDPEESWSMSKEDLHAYMDWFQESHFKKNSRCDSKFDRDADPLFRLRDVQPLKVVKDMGEEEILARSRRIQAAVTRVNPRPEPDAQEGIYRLGDLHQCFKEAKELEGPAKRFYEVTAEMAGLALEDLVKVVYSMEKMMFGRQKREKYRREGPREI